MGNKTENNAYLTFAIGNELYAIKVHKVVEVLGMERITKIPKSPESIKGVISFRGEIIPVFDIRIIAGLPAPPLDNYVITVLTVFSSQYNENLTVGAIADCVRNVIEIKPLDITPVSGFNSKIDPEFITGIYKSDGQLITILNTDNIFNISDIINHDNQFHIQ